MAVWLVRAGGRGEREQFALDQGLAVIGWGDLEDLSTIPSRDELGQLLTAAYPNEKPNTVRNWARQIWAFYDRIQIGDLVILPLKTRSAIAIGRATGPYAYRPDLPPDARHTRPVKWLRTDIPRSSVEQDLLYSLGAFLTVCQIQRNDAERRLTALVEGKVPPSLAPKKPNDTITDEEDGAVVVNVEEVAADQIRALIVQKFKGHGLARIVAAILKGQGFHTFISPPGADGGVDVIAGAGPLGFDPPRICVQVKSGDTPVDAKELRELQGVMKAFDADQGLLVSWSGFKQTTLAEARRSFFHIRLWDAGDLVAALQ